jgi:glycosyltransferase involved in cell wall biosynthesis
MIRTLGAESFIEWTGHLPFDRLPDFYRSLDVFAIPSSQEGFGIVGIEAMACGIPVISTRCGGPEDYVHPGQTGILVDHNAEQMAAALVQLIADRRLRQDMAQAARVLAETEYSPTRFRATLQTHWRMVWGEDP